VLKMLTAGLGRLMAGGGPPLLEFVDFGPVGAWAGDALMIERKPW
jgi:hypothetical protein